MRKWISKNKKSLLGSAIVTFIAISVYGYMFYVDINWYSDLEARGAYSPNWNRIYLEGLRNVSLVMFFAFSISFAFAKLIPAALEELKKRADEAENEYKEKRAIEKVRFKNFSPNKRIGSVVGLDDKQERIAIYNVDGFIDKALPYKKIIAFELLEDGEVITSGGLGRAAVGGLLFGGAGAIVGAVTGRKKGKTFVSSIKVKITVNDINKPNYNVSLLDKRVKTDSEEYKKAYEEAQELLSTLEVICKRNESSEVVEVNSTAKIREFKALFDDGIITEEEFASKKKELLGT